jgi:hypothetical protein
MWLTGHEAGPPLLPAADVPAAAGAVGGVDASVLLFGRSRLLGLSRHGRISAGGTARLLRCADGWTAVNLARPEDLDSVAAIIESDDGGEPLAALEAAARSFASVALADRCQLLGVPAAAVGTRTGEPAVRLERVGAGRSTGATRPFVVDLSSLWAGPLVAHLLGRAGAEVVKVESRARPDGARNGVPAFFDWLHAGHRSVVVDFASGEGRRDLRRLVEMADVVIASSRPRALAQLGIEPDDVVASGVGRIWVGITGYGARGDDGDRVAFGDDAAVAGGLVARDAAGDPVFCGDALADPLTGLYAAAAVQAAMAAGGGFRIDVSMADVAAHVAGLPAQWGPAAVRRASDGWVVEHGGDTIPVAAPPAPAVAGSAEHAGASTGEILARFAGA